MSSPQTNLETQKRRHKGPLIGIAVVLAFALVLLFLLITYVSDKGGVPEGAETQIDGRTGDEIPAEGS